MFNKPTNLFFREVVSLTQFRAGLKDLGFEHLIHSVSALWP